MVRYLFHTLLILLWTSIADLRTSHCAEKVGVASQYQFVDEKEGAESEVDLFNDYVDPPEKVPIAQSQPQVSPSEIVGTLRAPSFAASSTEIPITAAQSFVTPAESVVPVTQHPYSSVVDNNATATERSLPVSSFGPVVSDYSWQYYPGSNLSGRTPELHPLWEDSSILWSSWVSSGITFNPDSPSNRSNSPVLFNERSNDIQLNQAYFSLQKAISRDFDEFEFGWQADVVYGTDSRYVAVPGLENDVDRSEKWNSDTSDYGIALPQAFVRFGIPMGNGIDVKVGHFYSTAGFERFPSIQNLLYSHSYIFSYGVPFTHTGIVANYQLTPRTNVQLGYSRGWDNFNSVNNGNSFIGGMRLGNEYDKHQLNLSFTGGTEFSNIVNRNQPIIAPRYYGNATYLVRLSEKLRFATEFSGGYQEKGRIVVIPSVRRAFLADARFWGSAQYLISQFSERCIGVLRTEQFFDLDQNRIGIPISYRPGGEFFNGNSYYAVTAGLNWAATSTLLMRPELRYDWSDVTENKLVVGNNAPFRTFNDHTRSSQFTLACDVVVSF